MSHRLSILCVTKAEPFARPFLASMSALAATSDAEFVVLADGPTAVETLAEAPFPATIVPCQSDGFIESVLDLGVHACNGEYVLRLDDDEFPTPEMIRWLQDERFCESTHWKFARLHLWNDIFHFVNDGQLWPDHQTRLSLKCKAGGRAKAIHSGSPYGFGDLAPAAIEHHKFLVKTLEERRAIPWHTDSMRAFSCPEDVHEVVPFALIEEAVVV